MYGNINSPRECTMMMRIGEEQGRGEKFTAREIAEMILPAREFPVTSEHTRKVSTRMRYAQNRGWVKTEEVNGGKYRYYLTDSGRRYMNYLAESGKLDFI